MIWYLEGGPTIHYAPLEKGGILFCNCLSVGRYVGRSVVLSAQYLLTPSLDQYQTWCRRCSQWVNDPYWFSSHMFKGQGQTTVLSTLYILIPCLLASDSFCFYREDKPEFCTMGDIFVSETFLVLINLRLDNLWNFRLLCMVWQTIHGLALINIRKYNSLI